MTEQGSRSFKVRDELESNGKCGCYYCLCTFDVTEIEDWCDGEKTAICPKCGIDSVVAHRSSDGDRESFVRKLIKWRDESFS